LYQLVRTPAELDFDALPDDVVIKPTHLSAGKGVCVLSRRDGGFLDLLSRQILSPQDLVNHLSALEITDPGSRFLAEERVIPPKKQGPCAS
jgi:phosphoribosylamine-glycine ligase